MSTVQTTTHAASSGSITLPSLGLRALRSMVRLLPRGRTQAIRRFLPLLRPSECVLGTFDADRIRFAANLDEFISQRIFFHGWFEPVVTSLFLRLIGQGQTFLDVGANLGYFSFLAAARVGNVGRVVAFEPDPVSAFRFETNLALNGFSNVRLERLAIGMTRDRGRLCCVNGHEANQGGAWLIPAAERVVDGQTAEVEVIDLDAYCDEHGLERVDLVKIDIEGAEGEAIAGMSAGISARRYRRVLIELHTERLRGRGFPPEALLEKFRSAGYRCWRIGERSARRWNPYSVNDRFCLVEESQSVHVSTGYPHYLLSIENGFE